MTADTACFHCGEPLPARPRQVTIDGTPRPMCCPGCEAAAMFIADSGLDAFYRFRDRTANRPDEPAADDWSDWDGPALQARFVEDEGEYRAIDLRIEGLNCGACAWLIERVLAPVDGVVTMRVNPATAAGRLVWDPARTSLSDLLRRIARLGYRPQPAGSDTAAPAALAEQRAALRRLAVAGLGMMQVMMYAVALYAGAIHDDMTPLHAEFLRGVSLLVATPVVFYAGAPFFRGALRDLRARRPGMDVPVALAIGGAYAASVWHTLRGGGEVYFDSATMFVFFLSAARFLEMRARHQAGRATETLARLLPATATRLDADGNPARIALADVAVGDRLRVAAGDRIPADGTVLDGDSDVDESLLTGESRPQRRVAGEAVVGGTVNVSGPLTLRVERIGGATVVAGIGRLLARAQSERPALARLADRIAGGFISALLVLAGITAAVWMAIAPERAFEVTLAVLVVTCPCALSLATPAAVVTASARLARQGVLLTRAAALEVLPRVDHILLDKTGTLTRGRLAIAGTHATGRLSADDCRGLAAGLLAHSRHPVASAFAATSPQAGIDTVREVRGCGLEATVDGRPVRIGRPDWVAALHDGHPPTPDRGAATPLALADAAGPLALFELTDQRRPDARALIDGLRSAGLTVEIASGDAPAAVAALAGELDVDEARGGLSPEAKLARIRDLQARGRRVAVVGDGVNDGPVLAGADVAIALGSGSALARDAAAVILLGERLLPLLEARAVARQTLRVIRQNLGWALTYNAVALPLAASGGLAPWMAALGMSLSSLVVVANALRLGRVAHREAGAPAPRVAQA